MTDLDEIQRPLLPSGDNPAAQESVKDASAAGEGSRPDSQPENQSPEVDGPDSDGPGKPALPDDDEKEPEPTQGIWRALETNTKFQKIATIGGRVRASTTGLILALLVVGALALASSNPENADAGWLSPEHWRDSGAETSSSQLSDAPSTNPTPKPPRPARSTSRRRTALLPRRPPTRKALMALARLIRLPAAVVRERAPLAIPRPPRVPPTAEPIPATGLALRPLPEATLATAPKLLEPPVAPAKRSQQSRASRAGLLQ